MTARRHASPGFKSLVFSVPVVGVAVLFAGTSTVNASLLLAERRVFAPALLLAPRASPVVIPLAVQRLKSGTAQNALVTELRHALATDPLDHRAMLALSIAAERRGDLRLARALANQALAYNPRARPVRNWLLDDSLRRGDVRSSVAHIDRLLVLAPNNMRSQLLPALALLAQESAALAPIKTMLAARPIWMPDFVSALAAQQVEPSLIRGLIEPIATAGPESQDLYFKRLIDVGRPQEARLAWSSIRSGGPQVSTYVYDESFRIKDGRGPFAWTYPKQGNGSHEQVPGGGLRVYYLPNAPTLLAEQTLALPRGRYTLQLSGHIASGDPQAALSWHLSCKRGPVLATVNLPRTPSPTTVEANVAVANEDCSSQLLSLQGTPGGSAQTVTAETKRVAVERLDHRGG